MSVLPTAEYAPWQSAEQHPPQDVEAVYWVRIPGERIRACRIVWQNEKPVWRGALLDTYPLSGTFYVVIPPVEPSMDPQQQCPSDEHALYWVKDEHGQVRLHYLNDYRPYGSSTVCWQSIESNTDISFKGTLYAYCPRPDPPQPTLVSVNRLLM